MPRPPRPKHGQMASASAERLPDARSTWARSWMRLTPQETVYGSYTPWWCEFCRESVLVPTVNSRRALSSYLHDHRIHCNGNDPADEDEADEKQQ